MRRIDSRANPEIKLLSSLCDKKARDENRLFFFEGAHLLEDYLAAGLVPECVYVNSCGLERYSELLAGLDERTVLLSDGAFEKISTEKAPQGIITLSGFLPNIGNSPRRHGHKLYLASLRDAGNVGTILRTAAAFGISGVVCSDDCADLYSSKTVRASMGALFRLAIDVTSDISGEIASARSAGFRVFASALARDATVLSDGVLGRGDSVVIGNEGQGIPESVIATCDGTLIIPMEKGCESLNASAAATVFAWEMRRAEGGNG